MKKGTYKSQLTRFGTFFDSLNAVELTEANIIELKLKLAKVRPLLAEFEETQFELEVLLKAEQPEKRLSFENKYFLEITKAELLIQNLNNANNVPLSSNINLHDSVRLPKVDMPSFSGNYD